MPVYVYRCTDCGILLEKRQSFTDAPLTQCETCGGGLRKVLQPTMIIYKGSGFYSTDHRSPSGGNGGNGHGSENGEATKPAGDSTKPAGDSTKPATASSKESARAGSSGES